MKTDYFRAKTDAMRNWHGKGATAKRVAPKRTAYRCLDDFLRSCPVFSLNEYGEKVISGRRIC
jgi:hypothetical protein